MPRTLDSRALASVVLATLGVAGCPAKTVYRDRPVAIPCDVPRTTQLTRPAADACPPDSELELCYLPATAWRLVEYVEALELIVFGPRRTP